MKSRCHFSFSFRLLFLWLVSSSSFLSSLLWSWALLAGSRDLSLVPLPAYRTPSRLILCRAWVRALSPQPWIWRENSSQCWAEWGHGPAVLPITAPRGSPLLPRTDPSPAGSMGGGTPHPGEAGHPHPALASAQAPQPDRVTQRHTRRHQPTSGGADTAQCTQSRIRISSGRKSYFISSDPNARPAGGAPGCAPMDGRQGWRRSVLGCVSEPLA